MRTTLKQLSVLCASAMLLACAGVSQRAAAPGQSASAQSADDAYALGRQQHLARRYDEAIRSYRAALATDAEHVNARNGLATLYAEQGDFAQAIPIWRGLTEGAGTSSGPGTAFLFSNLGYAYFLSGDYQQALAALEKACLLDPLNYRAWQHLGSALHKLGQEDRARLMFRQANALEAHDFRADYAVAGGGARVTPIDTAVKQAAPQEREWASTDVYVAADGMLELRRIPASRPPASVALPAAMAAPVSVSAPVSVAAPLALPVSAAASEPPAAPSLPVAPALPATALLEIRNGNGVKGMAKSIASKVGDPGVRVVRLSNQKGYNVRQTRIEYQPAFRAAAERLAERFGNASVVEVDNCKSSDMRLVIGHDLIHARVALRPPARPVVAAARRSGRRA